ncbi:MAG: cytidine deaminase [Candidatus Thorarchaeota archaeon]
MTDSDEELIAQARQAQHNAYAPYSNFKVGAAILTEDGRIFTGCNVENSTFGATICAERTAVFTAICHDAKRFKKIVIISDNTDPVWPCGICRQVLFEFSPDIEVIAIGTSGKIERSQLTTLFPKGFKLEQ